MYFFLIKKIIFIIIQFTNWDFGNGARETDPSYQGHS